MSINTAPTGTQTSWEPVFDLRAGFTPEQRRSPEARAFMRRFAGYWNENMTDAWDMTFDADGNLLARQRRADYGQIGFAPWNVFAALQHFLQEELHVEHPFLPAASNADDMAKKSCHRERQMNEVWQWIFENWNDVAPLIAAYDDRARRDIDPLLRERGKKETTKERLAINQRIAALNAEWRSGHKTVFEIDVLD